MIQREFGTSDHGPVVATFSGFESAQPRTSSGDQKILIPETPGLLFARGQPLIAGFGVLEMQEGR